MASMSRYGNIPVSSSIRPRRPSGALPRAVETVFYFRRERALVLAPPRCTLLTGATTVLALAPTGRRVAGLDLTLSLALAAAFPHVLSLAALEQKKEAPAGEKPEPVRTRNLRNMIIVPEMIGGLVGVYNGKTFNQVEIKPEMIGHYLAEFSLSYKPVKHGRPGIGATHSSRFIPLK
ncbi:hypothetical protein EJB05_15471, partial [Eragrostis curvula]